MAAYCYNKRMPIVAENKSSRPRLDQDRQNGGETFHHNHFIGTLAR